MKKIVYLIVLFLSLVLNCTYGQYGLQSSIMIPAGRISYILKPALNIEFTGKSGYIDSRYKFGMALGLAGFKTTQDTLRTNTFMSGGNGNAILPSYEVYHKYQILSVGLTNEFTLFKDSEISPYIGMDLYFNLITYSEDSYAETLKQSSELNSNTWSIGILPRLGVQYQLNDYFLLSGGFGKSMSVGPPGSQTFWKPYINLSYYR